MITKIHKTEIYNAIHHHFNDTLYNILEDDENNLIIFNVKHIKVLVKVIILKPGIRYATITTEEGEKLLEMQSTKNCNAHLLLTMPSVIKSNNDSNTIIIEQYYKMAQ